MTEQKEHQWAKNWLPKEYAMIADNNILVIHDFQNALKLAVNNKVTYITDDKDKYKRFNKYVCNNLSFGKDDQTILINDWKNELSKEMEKMPKFDVCVMNPPYDKNLHLKILEQVIPHAEKVVNISPVRWLQDPFAAEKRSELKRFEETICKKLENVQLIPAAQSNKLFNIAAYADLGIYVTGTGFDYKNFWKLTRPKIEIDILNKVCNSSVAKLDSVIEPNKNNGIRTLIGLIAGNRGTKPIYKDLNYVINGKLNGKDWTKLKNMGGYEKPEGSLIPNSVKFNTITEAENFYNSYNTNFMNYICKISVQQQHIQPQKLPYMSDYTQPWTDKRFCDYFGITGYISDTEAEPNSEWEEILNTIKNKL